MKQFLKKMWYNHEELIIAIAGILTVLIPILFAGMA
jgi:hypothetical protein